MAKHPLMLEAIENAKAAAVSTRGMYPYTTATNVFYTDGTPLEEVVEEEEIVEDDTETEEDDEVEE